MSNPYIAPAFAGNGDGKRKPLDYDDAARLAHTLGQKRDLSAAERAKQRDAYIAAVDGMATVLRETVEWQRLTDLQLSAIGKLDTELRGRVEAIERAEAVRRSSFMARLRSLVLGR